jgi:SAM-dependent methyltransferase
MSKWKHWLDRESRTVEAFVAEFSARLPEGSLVLDAGAGGSPYGVYFKRQRYITADVPQSFNRGTVAVYADIARLPFANDQFDQVVCTQVLEHVPDPHAVIREIQRVLKPGGQVFLTVPQGWGIHNEPWHFFNFTCYGLQLLFDQAGLRSESILPRGGSLAYLGYRLHVIPRKVLKQYRRGTRLWKGRERDPKNSPAAYQLARCLLQPVFFLLDLLATVLIWADRWDCEKRFTLGYSCVARKPA